MTNHNNGTGAGEADYLIIGGGSAGCVLAARLTEDPSVSVTLLEAGGSDRQAIIDLPVGYARTMGDARYDWCYRAGPEPGLDGRTIHYARGRVLGGTSSINGLAWTRGGRVDYDRWQSLGCDGWNWDTVLPYFQRAERFVPGGAGRGTSGPVTVDFNPNWHSACRQLLEAGTEAGIPSARDYNVEVPFGMSRAQLNWRAGRRVNAAAAYLRPAAGRANLRVVTEFSAQRIVVEGGRAVGVSGELGGAARIFRACREVILCAGAIGSPLLLERSGIGKASRLEAMEIDVIVDSPEVGENAQDHWLVMMQFHVNGLDSINRQTRGVRAAVNLARYAASRTGLLSGTPTEMIGFARAAAGPGESDVQLFGSPMTFAARSVNGVMKFEPDREPGMSLGFYQCRPASRGSVHLQNQKGDANVIAGFLKEPEDRTTVIDGVKLCRRIMAQAAIAKYITRETAPGAEAQSDAALLEYAKRGGMTGFHLVGTCRMGADSKSVVDLELRLRGVSGLRVVDASIMPALVGANTHAPTVMIAERAADLIRGKMVGGTHSLDWHVAKSRSAPEMVNT